MQAESRGAPPYAFGKVVPDPASQTLFLDLACGKSEEHRRCLLGRHIEIDVVQSEKYDDRGEGYPFVAIHERVIAGEAESVCGSKLGKVFGAVGMLVPGPSQCRFEETDIAYAVGATEEGKLFGVNIKGEFEVEPLRLAHFASALNVSAYLLNARRAISMPLAWTGS